MKDQLSFEGAKETFDGCIVVTISFAAHGNRTHHSSLCQQSLILAAGVLTAPVRVMQQARRRLANGDGHLQSVNDQLPVQAITHGPAHNAPGVKVQDHCQIEPPLCGRHISDIGQPDLVRPVSGENLVKLIGSHPQIMVTILNAR